MADSFKNFDNLAYVTELAEVVGQIRCYSKELSNLAILAFEPKKLNGIKILIDVSYPSRMLPTSNDKAGAFNTS